MAILENENVNALQEFVKQHKKAIKAFYEQTEYDFRKLANDVWNNRNFTPQEIIGEYGNLAVELFQLSSLMQGTLETASGKAVTVVPTGWTITPNADGTITLTPPPEPEPTPEPTPEE